MPQQLLHSLLFPFLCTPFSLSTYRYSSSAPGHLTHMIQPKNSIQGVEQFWSDFFATCRLPRLQFFDSYKDFDLSDDTFLPQMYIVCVRWCDNDLLQNIFGILSHLPRIYSSLLCKAPCWCLVDLSILDVLSRRRRIVCQKTLLACQELESSLPEIPPGLHFGLFHRESCGFSRLSVSHEHTRFALFSSSTM